MSTPLFAPAWARFRSGSFGVVLAGGLIALASLASSPALAQDFTLGALTVEQPWSRATPGGAKVAAGYLVIKNAGDTSDRLVSVTADVAAEVSPHTMSMKDGMMTMRPLDRVVIPAHGTTAFKPAGDHLMIEGLKHPLKQGGSFAASLTFEKAGTISVVFQVQSMGAQVPAAEGGGSTAAPMQMK